MAEFCMIHHSGSFWDWFSWIAGSPGPATRQSRHEDPDSLAELAGISVEDLDRQYGESIAVL